MHQHWRTGGEQTLLVPVLVLVLVRVLVLVPTAVPAVMVVVQRQLRLLEQMIQRSLVLPLLVQDVH
jgi:hypothetical protein